VSTVRQSDLKDWRLTLTDLVRYSGASGDFNPLHHDAAAAQAAGMAGVFGHGMLSAGLLASVIVDSCGLNSIISYSVRFTNQSWPGDTLVPKLAVSKREEALGVETITLDCRLMRSETEDVVRASALVVPGGAPQGVRAKVSADLAASVAPIVTPIFNERATIEAGPVARFADAVYSPQPEYRSIEAAQAAGFAASPVPPTFPIALRFWSTDPPPPDAPRADDPRDELNRTSRVRLHGEQTFIYHRLLSVGDVVIGHGGVGTPVAKASSRGPMTIVPIISRYTDPAGEPVVTAVATAVYLG
jgi:acyl dehydratase